MVELAFTLNYMVDLSGVASSPLSQLSPLHKLSGVMKVKPLLGCGQIYCLLRQLTFLWYAE